MLAARTRACARLQASEFDACLQTTLSADLCLAALTLTCLKNATLQNPGLLAADAVRLLLSDRQLMNSATMT
jgi:hypothetical protein